MNALPSNYHSPNPCIKVQRSCLVSCHSQQLISYQESKKWETSRKRLSGQSLKESSMSTKRVNNAKQSKFQSVKPSLPSSHCLCCFVRSSCERMMMMMMSRGSVPPGCSDIETYPEVGSHSPGFVVRSRETVEDKLPCGTKVLKAHSGHCYGSGFGIDSKPQSLL